MLESPVTHSRALVASRAMCRIGVVGLVLTVVTYLLTTFTTAGQVIVDDVWLARVSEGRGLLKASRDLLELIDLGTVAGVVIALVAVSAVGGRWRAGAALGIGLIGAVASAEVLKVVLPRPDLAPRIEAMMGAHAANSFPSGHVTIVTASVIAALILIPAAHRGAPTLLAGLLVAAVSCAVVAAGWHRPSDALGGLGWGLAWQCLMAAVVIKRFGRDARSTRPVRWWGPTASGLIMATVVLVALLGSIQKWQWSFALAEGVLASAAVIAITATGWALRNVDVTTR